MKERHREEKIVAGIGRCAALVVMAALMLSTAARAMDIKDYFRMVAEDQANFNQMLLDTAEKELRDQGHGDLAQQLDKLFTEIPRGHSISQGNLRRQHGSLALRS